MKATHAAPSVRLDPEPAGLADGYAMAVEHLSKRFGERIGKALAVLVPALVVSYAIFGVFLAMAALFARPGVVSAVFAGSHLLIQLLFTPLLAGWSIWVGIAMSARSADVRVAQQLGVLASAPPLAIVALITLNVIPAPAAVALGPTGALLLADGFGWRAAAGMFDRERLVTGTS
jgi:hypothetical protein